MGDYIKTFQKVIGCAEKPYSYLNGIVLTHACQHIPTDVPQLATPYFCFVQMQGSFLFVAIELTHHQGGKGK